MFGEENDLSSKTCNSETIWVCGASTDGQLPINKKTDIKYLTPIHERDIFPFGNKLKWIGAGDHFTIFVTRSNVVYGAGQNKYGQIGLDHCKYLQGITRVPFFDHKHIVNISCGAFFSFFLEEVGNKQNLFACGNNSKNPLGLGKREEKGIYPPQTVDLQFLEENDSIDKIVCGFESTLLLTRNGKIYGCGNNDSHQIGISSRNATMFERSNLDKLLDGEKVIDMSLGTSYSLLLTNLGNIYTNGGSKYELTKIGLNLSPFEKIHCGASTGFVKVGKQNALHPRRILYLGRISLHNSILIEDRLHLINQIPEDEDIIITGGVTAFFFITKDYKVYCCGNDGRGELGIENQTVGHTKNNIVRHHKMEDIIRKTRSLNGNAIPTIVAGYSHTILYFRTEETRDYLRFFSNLERHVFNTTFLSDVTFNF
ncbi:hypothetical protein ABK040_002097 [Willaertia magna]